VIVLEGHCRNGASFVHRSRVERSQEIEYASIDLARLGCRHTPKKRSLNPGYCVPDANDNSAYGANQLYLLREVLTKVD
jgi:hypothetical protein